MGNKLGVGTDTIIYTDRAKKRKKAYNKRFNKRYKLECGECITRKASKEEIDALINNLLNKH